MGLSLTLISLTKSKSLRVSRGTTCCLGDGIAKSSTQAKFGQPVPMCTSVLDLLRPRHRFHHFPPLHLHRLRHLAPTRTLVVQRCLVIFVAATSEAALRSIVPQRFTLILQRIATRAARRLCQINATITAIARTSPQLSELCCVLD